MLSFLFEADVNSVAFTAFIDASSAQYNSLEVVEFAYAATNIGNHFDSNTFTFTCPVTAVYEFRLHLQSSAAQPAQLDIKLDGDVIATALARDSTYEDSATTSAIVDCSGGSTVKVTTGNDVSYVAGGYRTVFSGKLLTVDTGTTSVCLHCRIPCQIFVDIII